jgi:preprotein translocase subunit SecE
MARLPQKKTSAKKKKKRTEGGNTAAVAGKAEAPEAKVLPKAEKEIVAKKKSGPVVKKTTAPVPKAAVTAHEKNFLQKTMQFLREVKTELKKVTWPSRKQTLGSTLVVMVLVLIIAFFLGAVDIGLSSLVKMVLQ